MKKYIKILPGLILAFLLFACAKGLDDTGKVLRNEKITNNDEFLVEKRKPLILPPDYNKLPVPGSANKKSNSGDQNIKKILKVPEENQIQKNKSSSLEESILENIKK